MTLLLCDSAASRAKAIAAFDAGFDPGFDPALDSGIDPVLNPGLDPALNPGFDPPLGPLVFFILTAAVARATYLIRGLSQLSLIFFAGTVDAFPYVFMCYMYVKKKKNVFIIFKFRNLLFMSKW